MDPVKAEFWRLARLYLTSRTWLHGNNLREFIRDHTPHEVQHQYLLGKTTSVIERIEARDENRAATPQTR